MCEVFGKSWLIQENKGGEKMRSKLRVKVKRITKEVKEADKKADNTRDRLTRLMLVMERCKQTQAEVRRKKIHALKKLTSLKKSCSHEGVIVEYGGENKDDSSATQVKMRMCLDCGLVAGPDYDDAERFGLRGNVEPVSEDAFRHEWKALNPDSNYPLDSML